MILHLVTEFPGLITVAKWRLPVVFSYHPATATGTPLLFNDIFFEKDTSKRGTGISTCCEVAMWINPQIIW